MDTNFKNLKINQCLCQGLEKLNIVKPTEVQEKVIPCALNGDNVIAQSETGTGKTLAYLLPVIQRIDIKEKTIQSLILAPTHELTMQIHNTILDIKKASGIDSGVIALVGSGNINRQIEKLKSKPQIATGSPGRILDLIKKKKLHGHTIKFLVIDEFDKLLDSKNIQVIEEILKALDNNVQIVMVSATVEGKTLEIAKKIMNNPEIIKVSKGDSKVNPNITHQYFLCEDRKKVELLRKVIHWEKPKKALVFVNSNYDVNMTLEKLRYHNISCNSISGNISKEDRKKALEDFRKGAINVLISSDLGARGLDINGITHVINLDMPKENKDYVHRAGRVARGENQGKCISLVTPGEVVIIEKYKKIFNIDIDEKILYKGKIFNNEE